MFKIRLARKSDFGYFPEMTGLLKKSKYTYPCSIREIQLTLERGRLVICLENKNLVGFGRLMPFFNFRYKDKNLTEIASLFVKKEHRRKGIAKKMVSKLLNNAPADSLIFLTTENPITKKIFLKRGFRRIDFEELGEKFVKTYCQCSKTLNYYKCRNYRNKVCQLFIKNKPKIKN